MDPIFGGLISGGMSLLNGFFSSQAADKSMQFNAQQAQMNRDWQTQMANTAYQRASTDMKAAGLNPMMMFGSGGAAATPGGAQASVQATAKSPFEGIGDTVNKVLSSAIQAKTLDKMTEEIANLRATQARTEAETASEKTRPGFIGAQTEKTLLEGADVANRLPVGKLQGMSAKDVMKLPDWVRASLNIGAWSGNKVGDVLAPIASSATAAGRVAQAFESLKSSSQVRKFREGNFIDKYGVPIDEYLSH